MAKADVMLCFLMLLGFFYCNAAKSNIETPAEIKAISCSTETADSFDLQKSLNIMDLNRRLSNEVKKLLKILDKNGDGSINIEELKLILQCFPPRGTAVSDAESKAAMANFDLNGDVKLGLNELWPVFLKIMIQFYMESPSSVEL